MLGAGIDVDFWPTYDEYGGRKPHLFPFPSSRDQNVNFPIYINIRVVSSCVAINWCYVYIV